MVKKILIAIGVVFLAFVIFVATRPADFSISRSATVQAPPPVVFGLVNDFKQWPRWSPWEKLDSSMKREYLGAPAGVGSAYHWAGNDKAGEGRMTIVESTPSSKIEIKLEFTKPFEATNQTVFAFSPAGEGTQVTWTMTGKKNFVAKAFSLFMDMDKMVGKDFEAGLRNMNDEAKAMPPPAPVVDAAPEVSDAGQAPSDNGQAAPPAAKAP